MRRMRFTSLAVLALATATMGLWVGGCSKDQGMKTVLAPHGVQTTPSGQFSMAWSGVDVRGSGRIVVPGQLDLVLTRQQVNDLGHSLLNVSATGRHGWEVTPETDSAGVVSIAVDPHPHGVAKLRLAYDAETGRAEGSFVPATFPAPSAALNTLMKEYVARSTGIANPQDVTATKFEVASEGYSLHWTPDGKGLGSGDIAYPALMVNGLTIEGVFYVGETQGTFTATIDRMTADLSGALVADCPECAMAPSAPGHRPYPPASP